MLTYILTKGNLTIKNTETNQSAYIPKEYADQLLEVLPLMEQSKDVEISPFLSSFGSKDPAVLTLVDQAESKADYASIEVEEKPYKYSVRPHHMYGEQEMWDFHNGVYISHAIGEWYMFGGEFEGELVDEQTARDYIKNS